MSETKLVVRDDARDASLICHGSDAHRVVAALSADPMMIEELDVALQRFMAVDPGGGFFHGANNCVDDEPWDSGLVVIDLDARLIVVDSTYFTTKHTGQVFYHGGDVCTNVPVGYSIADDWEISNDAEHWEDLAADRRRQRIGKTMLDTRAVLYGLPLLEFLATGCWEAFQHGNQNLDSAAIQPSDRDDERVTHPCNDPLKDIHASWLMTPCAELESRVPRDVLLADRQRLSEDMQQRCDQWARTQECPRGLDESSHAFRFGGFGTHELVKYYELVRELLRSCWSELAAMTRKTSCRSESVELADFLNSEIPRLERVRNEWLNTPDPECHLRTPQSIIDRERARLPEALFGKDAMIDPDCPCCQMLAELPGPTFMHLDASGMDWEFPFDIYCRTREEWDAQQREYAEFSESPNDDAATFGIPIPPNGPTGNSPIWKRSFSMAESTDLPIGVRLLGIAWHIAELVMELNELVESESSTEQLNHEFRNLRGILAGTDSSRMESLLDPAQERFGETLGDIADRYPTLEPRCSDLARKIKSLREPSAPVSS